MHCFLLQTYPGIIKTNSGLLDPEEYFLLGDIFYCGSNLSIFVVHIMRTGIKDQN